jgi:hypothetical protein
LYSTALSTPLPIAIDREFKLGSAKAADLKTHS